MKYSFLCISYCIVMGVWRTNAGLIGDISDKAFLAHIKVLQQLKARNLEKFEPITNKVIGLTDLLKNKKCTSQSYAYLTTPGLLGDIHKDWARAAIEQSSKNLNEKEKTQSLTLINDVLDRECKHADKNYVFYHGATMKVWLLQHAIEKIESWMQLLPHRANFAYLRAPVNFQEQTVSDFIAREKPYEKETWIEKFDDAGRYAGSEYFDQVPHIREQLISTNISLFGNSQGFERGNVNYSSSIYFWLYNFSLITHDIVEKSLLPLFKKYQLDGAYLRNIESLFNKLESNQEKYGVLLQIFIPKSIVNNVAYPSIVGGFPLKTSQGSYWKMSDFLDTYMSKANTLDQELSRQNTNTDLIQARILITPTLYNPETSIAIYRYTLANHAFIKSIEQQLDALLDELFKDWITHLPDLLSEKLEKTPQLSPEEMIELKNAQALLREKATTLEHIEEQMRTMMKQFTVLSTTELSEFAKNAVDALDNIARSNKDTKKISSIRTDLNEFADYVQERRTKEAQMAEEAKTAKPEALSVPLRLAKYLEAGRKIKA